MANIGGFTALKTADGGIQAIVNQVLPTVNERTHKNYRGLVSIVYQSQVVNGINYRVLVRAEPNNYLKLEIGVIAGNDVPGLTRVEEANL